MIRRLGKRSLIDEPLTVEDWREIHMAFLGFQSLIEAIVRRARARGATP